jgi:hypothetical protein
MTTDTSEKGLESLIVAALVGRSSWGDRPVAPAATGEHHGFYDNAGYINGDPRDFDREHA